MDDLTKKNLIKNIKEAERMALIAEENCASSKIPMIRFAGGGLYSLGLSLAAQRRRVESDTDEKEIWKHQKLLLCSVQSMIKENEKLNVFIRTERNICAHNIISSLTRIRTVILFGGQTETVDRRVTS